MNRTTSDTWLGVVLFIAAVVYWLEAGKIRISPLDDLVGAAGLPKSLAYVLGGLALVLIVRSISDAKSRERCSSEAQTTLRSFWMWVKPHLRALGMLAIGVGYVLLLPVFGYTLSIAALLLTVSLYNGANLNLRTILVAVVGAGLCQLLFVQFLGIPLPSGKLPGLIALGL
jgi:hypothetical protein